MANRALDERQIIEWITSRSGTPPEGDTWIGDDTAVIASSGGVLLFATDTVVEGVHFLSGPSYLADAGWKALVRNVSDIAAMGGTPTHAVVAVSGASTDDLVMIDGGLQAAANTYGCPIVGGDLSVGASIVITVAILGRVATGSRVLRSGARPGDGLYVTGSLGRASAGLRQLLADPGSTGPNVDAHRRPQARLAEGQCAAVAGATAMIDLSDGLGIDLHRLADASGIGFSLDEIPVAPGASLDDALSGGDDYELLFSAPGDGPVSEAFAARGIAAPLRIGVVVADTELRALGEVPLPPGGWQHDLR